MSKQFTLDISEHHTVQGQPHASSGKPAIDPTTRYDFQIAANGLDAQVRQEALDNLRAAGYPEERIQSEIRRWKRIAELSIGNALNRSHPR